MFRQATPYPLSPTWKVRGTCAGRLLAMAPLSGAGLLLPALQLRTEGRHSCTVMGSGQLWGGCVYLLGMRWDTRLQSFCRQLAAKCTRPSSQA